ncbi:MAG TPA: hypothetical protein VMZ27_00650 [Candidatus Saccharimonadales bacterium]|nr:hypothetical protein [Candidatus Saccharimonadales bacterium]
MTRSINPRLALLLSLLAAIGFVAWFFAINLRPGVRISFVGLESVYTDHEFIDVALFSFTNSGKVDVTLFDWKVSPSQGWVGPSRLHFFVHDADSTNAIVFRGIRELGLKPGRGQFIAIPAAHGTSNWQAQLEYNYEGLRNKFALWLGPARGGNLVPSLLRRIKTERYDSEPLPFLPQDKILSSPSARSVNLTLEGPRSGVMSTFKPIMGTNASKRLPLPSQPGAPRTQ